jgi:hypothetical protein
MIARQNKINTHCQTELETRLTVGKRTSQRVLKTALKSPERFSQTLLAIATEILKILLAIARRF